MIIIGVDWSLNSASVCFKNTENGTYKWLAIVKDENKAVRKLNTFKECELIVLEKTQNTIINADEMSKIFIHKVKEIMYEWNCEDIIFVFENFAYSAKGNSLLDIVENTSIVKYNIMKTFGEDKIVVLSPTSVKKRFTGSGKANKQDMLNTFKENKLNNMFYHYCMKLNKAHKPEEDMIDAYAVIDAYQKILKENEEI